MKTRITSIAVCLLAALGGGCSKRSHHQETPHDRVVALAKRFDCSVLSDEINKVAGSNVVDSILIQRVLENDTRFASEATLCDVAQAGEKTDGIFELESAGKFECAARLECPTNFIPILSSGAREWAIAFEPGENRNTISISQLSNGEEVVVSGVIVEGKLDGLEALSPLVSGTNLLSAQNANSTSLSVKQLMDGVNARGHEGIFYIGLAQEFGFPLQSVYPCRHIDTPDKLRSLYTLSIDGANYLVIIDVHSENRWAFVIEANGRLKKAIWGLKGQPSKDVTTWDQAASQLAVENTFWSAWLAIHTDLPGTNASMPTNKSN